jgi:hypothetical protein
MVRFLLSLVTLACLLGLVPAPCQACNYSAVTIGYAPAIQVQTCAFPVVQQVTYAAPAVSFQVQAYAVPAVAVQRVIAVQAYAPTVVVQQRSAVVSVRSSAVQVQAVRVRDGFFGRRAVRVRIR